MCQHSLRRDFRYLPSVNARQCRWCGTDEHQHPEYAPSETPSSFETPFHPLG